MDVINYAKIKQIDSQLSEMSTISVKTFGAKGDGTTDDTAAIQLALDFTTNSLRYVKIPDGNYMVNPYVKLKLKSNTRLEFSKNAYLTAINTNQDITSMLDIRNVENIEVINPQIVGDRDTNTQTTEGAGHGICIINVKNLKISGGNISKCFTDGIYVNTVENCLIEFVTSDNNRRQGMSVTCARNFLCRNSTFKNTNGTAPMMGIDIEPNYSTDYLENVVLENIYTENNSASGIGINYNQLNNTDTVIDVTIRNWKDKGSKNTFTCMKYSGSISEMSTIRVENLKSIDAKESGIMIMGHKADGTAKISLIRPSVHNCNTINGTNERSQNVAISVHTETTGYPAGTVQGNCEIIEPTITMATGRTILRGMYIGYGNTIKKVTIKDPLKIDIGDMTTLSTNNNHNLLSFNQTVISDVLVSDKYSALACNVTSAGGLIRNYSTSLYSKFILNTASATQVKECIRWDIANEVQIINNLCTNLSVFLPSSTYSFIDETNVDVTGKTYSSTVTGGVLYIKKIKDNLFRVIKEYGTWTVA